MTEWKNEISARLQLINTMAEKRFGNGPLAEEAALFVLDMLQQDNWKKVRSYHGKASFTTYLRSVVFRSLEDFSRKRFGRLQPPQWIRRLGGFWLHLYKFLCLERLSITEAVERSLYRSQDLEKDVIENAAYEIKGRVVNCGGHQALEVALEDHNNMRWSTKVTPENQLAQDQRLQLLQLIFGNAVGEDPGSFQEFNRVLDLPFELRSQEKLLLKLRYVDGFSVSRIAVLLDVSRHQVNGRLRRLLARLRTVLEQAGLAEEVLDQLRENNHTT